MALAVLVACSGGGSETIDDPLAPLPTVRGPGVSFGLPELLGRIEAPGLTRASGLVASRRTPGNLWSHNDAGDGPLLFCLGPQGVGCGVVEVTGAAAVDWEDLAAGPGPLPDVPYLYVGDIGDPGRSRTEIVVYRIPEPAPPDPPSPPDAPTSSEPAEVLVLRYPDGPHDAEALMVHPARGDVYVITKDASRTSVYRADGPLTGGETRVLGHVTDLEIGFTAARSRQVTAADISPDGTHVAFLTYAEGYELTVPAGVAFDEIWRRRLVPFHLPDRQRGEALAYRLDSGAVITTEEDAGARLHQMARKDPPPP